VVGPVRAALAAGLCALFVPGLLAAQSGPASPEFTLGGLIALDGYQYLQDVEGRAPPGTEAAPGVAQIRFAPTLRARYRFVRASAEVELRHDFLDPGRGSRVILREAVVGLRTHGFRLEGGALQARWGKMDVASPTDNIVAWDYEELLFAEPLPVPGIEIGFARGVFSAEVIAVPAFVPARFRHAEPSRWDNTWGLPQTQTVPTGIAGDLVFGNRYDTFTEPVAVGGGGLLNAWDVGGRVDLFLPSVDLGVSLLYSRDKLPTYTAFRVTNNLDLDGDGLGDHVGSGVALLEITPHHERLLIPGLDVAVNVWRLVFKGEAAYFHTRDPGGEDCLIDDPYIKYAIGAEITLPEIVGDFGLAFRLQYNGDVATTSAERRDEQSAACPGKQVITVADSEAGLLPTDYETGFQATPEIRHPYAHAFYFNVHADLPANLAIDVRGFADFHGDALIRGHLQYEVLERLTLSGGALVMLSTGEDTLFTPYGRNSRVEVGLAYRF